MKSTCRTMLILVICSTFFTCRDRDPVNPLDPDNPTTHGQAYTIHATATGIGKVVVHWRRIDEPQVKGYRLYRSISGGGAAFSPIANVSDSQYVDARLQPRTYCDYYYRILWEDGRELHQSPTSGDSTFDAPTGFIIRTVTRTRVELQWNDLRWLDNYAQCRLYRRSGAAYALYDSTTSSSQYIDSMVDTGVTYRYELVAVGTDGSTSNFSGEQYATPGNHPPVIDSLFPSQSYTPWGGQVSITCDAHDADGDPITYSWRSLDGGSINGAGQAVTFQLPQQDSILTYRIVATISDGYSMGMADTISIASGPSGLVAYYPFNGNANDESGNGNNGTLYGATPTTDRFGRINSAYAFDGNAQYVNANFTPNPVFSISIWIKKSSQQNDNAGVLSTYSGGFTFNGVYYALSGSGEWIRCDGNSLNGFNSSDTNWKHIAIVSDGTNVRVYENSSKMLDFIGTTNHSAPLVFADSRYNGRYFAGCIDDIRVYNRALTLGEINALYHEDGY